jgi:hypothetical protein
MLRRVSSIKTSLLPPYAGRFAAVLRCPGDTNITAHSATLTASIRSPQINTTCKPTMDRRPLISDTPVLGGSMLGPFGTTLSPFPVARSGAPFNITTRHDNNGDTVFTDRPAFATSPNQPGVEVTPFGVFNPNPASGSAFIPHNYGRGRYNLTVGIIVRNLLNNANSGMPVGNLSSPYFGRSNWLASTAGPADVAFGNNRRLQFQLRFDF